MDGKDLFVRLQVFLQTLADANRLRILSVIGDKKCSVTEIVQELDLSQPLVSHHLRALKDAGIVQTERRGPFVLYWMSDVRLSGLLGSLTDLVPADAAAKTERTDWPFVCPPWWPRG